MCKNNENMVLNNPSITQKGEQLEDNENDYQRASDNTIKATQMHVKLTMHKS